jgi:opacity protein-like surface antigen
MKNILLAVVAAGSLLESRACAAEPVIHSFKPYIRVFADVSNHESWDFANFGSVPPVPQYETNLGTGFGGAIGAALGESVRAEIELSRNSWGNNLLVFPDGGALQVVDSVAATYLLNNVWLDWHNSSHFTPYLGGGLGVGWFGGEEAQAAGGPTYALSTGGANFAYQLGAGIQLAISDTINLDLGYRLKRIVAPNMYVDTTRITANTLTSHNFEMGLTLHF